MSKQMSASKRVEDARALLASITEVEAQIEASTEADGMDEVFEARDAAGDLLERAAAAIRALIEPPTIFGSVEEIRDELVPKVQAYAAREGLSDLGVIQAALRFGIDGGIDAAHESWEPDDYAEKQGVHAAVYTALKERGNKPAADYVYANEDDVWGQHIGPMLDAIEEAHS